MDIEPLTPAFIAPRSGRYIYIACPWTQKGGGMFKVADYLIQAQAFNTPPDTAELRALDTRGGANALCSLWFLMLALGKIVRGKLSGELAGVHVNMAERLSFFRKGAVVAWCRMLGVPVVLHLHAAQLHHSYRSSPKVLQALMRWIFSLPSRCVVLGRAARRFVNEELQVPLDRIEIVINGVPRPTEPRRNPIAQKVQRVLFVGNLGERKGVSDLLRALAVPGLETARLEVTFAGDGDIDGYRKRSRELGVDRFVRFAGWSDQQEVARLMARADVLVLVSYDEGLPLVILEAMANSVAVICSPVGEIPSVLTDGVNACFVTAGDVPGIAFALQQVLRHAPVREMLESNGHALYEKQFSLGRFSAAIAAIHRREFGIAGLPVESSLSAQEASF